ncbi:MAG: hypothetical protein D4R96_03345, partial [Nitrosopumilaceae archaeon]
MEQKHDNLFRIKTNIKQDREINTSIEASITQKRDTMLRMKMNLEDKHSQYNKIGFNLDDRLYKTQKANIRRKVIQQAKS